MTDAASQALVTTQWLSTHLDDPSVRIVDASWHMPALRRDAVAEFQQAHIPGAVHFDIDDIADDGGTLPHMVPGAEKFEQRVASLGIGNGHHVVVYDTTGVGSAARVWWMFRLFGHDKVSVVDGGLRKWQAEGRAVESGAAEPGPATYVARRNDQLLRTAEQLLRNVQSRREQVLDARSAGRFNGTEPEPRQGLRGGHIPGSFNRPFLDLYDASSRTMKSRAELTALFDASGIDRNTPIVTSCGSGVTACNLALGLFLIGKSDVAVYDGSWTEWGGREDTPIES